ncbi:TetR/AcrR family transcriptional regulator [Anaerofustis stercorihominis]|uniref:Transcriptional regulator, TetR family n=2 Tax=Anaerofustis stercorihominis TaxID=214853 RepID=B1C8Z8_9FIRM|nr:TetR/AcrR family transcriptional regulator [Anaerofustis stercorihominis]EDS72058.1 transcriptional regulator, TetR family [Anaerofustis stercorihominis DSM 17244]MCQ4795892.1 TetR/AcrR family transcriptional regulator [Anaerofustis stercorihominis]RGD74891.1 TetR/AcrR family transcriptional regulator [Anaerofustis stercorihominis]
MGIIEDKKKLKLDALLDSAFSLFITKGIEKTSVSDITKKAKVAKGTFYLYFKNKYDINDTLIFNKSTEIFNAAKLALEKENINEFHERIIFIVDYIINFLDNNPIMLSFIAKNLSWAVFKKVIIEDNEEDNKFKNYFDDLINSSGYEFDNHELMLYTILEFVNSTCYNVILYNEPVKLEVLKKFLYKDINSIINNHIIKK